MKWLCSTAEKSWVTLISLYLASKEPGFAVIFLKWSWVTVQAFWRRFKTFLWKLSTFSLIFSKVLKRGHFKQFFSPFCLLNHLTRIMTYESFGHKKGISRDESVLCLHITDNLEKELFLKCIFRHFVTVSLLQEQTICALFLNWWKILTITQAWNVIFAQTEALVENFSTIIEVVWDHLYREQKSQHSKKSFGPLKVFLNTT